jgi:protein ImuA
MIKIPSDILPTTTLEQLLLREDTWLGHSQRFTSRRVLGTGYAALDSMLLNHGWPLGSLIEVCQQNLHGEWQLFLPALREISGLVVLVNPPATPFSQAFIQAGIDLERLIVVTAPEKDHFLTSFLELARASVGALLAWQPLSLSYTQIRKCLLASTEGTGLSVLFRPRQARQHSSPAGLRLLAQTVPTGLEVTVFKQKGQLQTRHNHPLILSLPQSWAAQPAYHQLDQPPAEQKSDAQEVPRVASVTNLRSKP